jgi:hypothetical protein
LVTLGGGDVFFKKLVVFIFQHYPTNFRRLLYRTLDCDNDFKYQTTTALRFVFRDVFLDQHTTEGLKKSIYLQEGHVKSLFQQLHTEYVYC